MLLGYGPDATADIVAKSSPSSGADASSTHADDSHPATTLGGDPTRPAAGSSHTGSASASEGPTSTLGSGREPGESQAGGVTHGEEHAVDSAVTAETHSVDTADTPSADAVDTPSADTIDAHSIDTADTNSSDTAETHSTDTADTHSTDTIGTHSANTIGTHSTDTADAPTTDAAATESTDTTDTPAGLLAGTLLTGTAGLDLMGLFGTDSGTPSTDWGSIASSGTSAPSADDTSGSTQDTVAAPVPATAPEDSATHEEATSEAAPAVGAAAAAASTAPTPTEAAPTELAPTTAAPVAAVVPPPAEVVPPPVAVCVTADNCTTVLQAMLTSVANMVIAPLSTVSSWSGAIWYQATPEAAARASNRWTAAGAPAGPELASLLMPSGLPTVLRYNTVRGGIPSVGETVQEQIDTLDQTMQASSSPMSSQITVTTSTTAPRQFTRFVEHALDTIAGSPSLMVLTVAALPGLGGFLIIIGAGMRIGYRQAKFSFAMRSSGLARYVRPGPLGVVRSGGLIAVRPRLRTRSQRFLEEAA
jgi:hypothetical protein